jgi:hypothetical protein
MAQYAGSILIDATDDEVATLVEENLFSLFRAMARNLPDGQLVERDQLSYHLTFPTNPMFKGVWRTRLTADDADRFIDETLDWFRAQGAPFMFWWTGTATTPADIGSRLIARGLLSYEVQTEEFASGIVSTDLGAPGMGGCHAAHWHRSDALADLCRQA